jgi:hypothetical protein
MAPVHLTGTLCCSARPPKARLKDIEAATGAKKIIIDQFNGRLASVDKVEDEDDAAVEREDG